MFCLFWRCTGCTATWLVYNFYKYRNNLPAGAAEVTNWPRVTIQLPIFNERYVIERLVEAMSRFDYPRELLDVQVLDDSIDETRRSCARVRGTLSGARLADSLLCTAPNRTGYKAGALAEGLKTAKGEYVAIFDADFVPSADFLRRTLPYFHESQNRDGARRAGRI